jgi:hypothetical protein
LIKLNGMKALMPQLMYLLSALLLIQIKKVMKNLRT